MANKLPLWESPTGRETEREREEERKCIRTKMLIKIEAFKRQITQTMRSKLMLLARLVLCYQQ